MIGTPSTPSSGEGSSVAETGTISLPSLRRPRSLIAQRRVPSGKPRKPESVEKSDFATPLSPCFYWSGISEICPISSQKGFPEGTQEKEGSKDLPPYVTFGKLGSNQALWVDYMSRAIFCQSKLAFTASPPSPQCVSYCVECPFASNTPAWRRDR